MSPSSLGEKHFVDFQTQDQLDDYLDDLDAVESTLGSLVDGTDDALRGGIQTAVQVVRKIRNSLKKSDVRAQDLMERVPAVVFNLDTEGKILYINRAIGNLTGFQPEDLINQNWWDVFFTPEQQGQVDLLRELAKTKNISGCELALTARDGRVVTLEISTENNYDEEGKLTSTMGFGIDVTLRKRIEDKLKRRERELDKVQQIAHLGSWIWDIPSNVITWSDEMYRIYGLTPQEGGLSYEDFIARVHPDDREMVQNIVRAASRDLKPFAFEHRIIRPDGQIWTLSTRGEVILGEEGKPLRMIGSGQDITGRKTAEEELRSKEEGFRLLVESVKEYAIFTLDPRGYVTSWNIGAETIKGFSAEEIIGQHYSRFFPQEDIDRGKPQANLDIAVREGRCEDEGWRVRKDGSRFWANIVLTALRAENGELRGFSKVVRDMTQRKEAEERIRQSEARFRTIFYGAAVGIELVDLEGHLLEFNPAIGKIFGYSHKELRQSIASDTHHPANVVVNSSVFEEFKTGKRIFYYAEKPFVHKDGHPIWGRLTVNLVNDANGEPQFLIGMIEDVSEQKQMESELVELKRRLMEGRESERLHLAQELHDGPIQDLYGLTYDFSALEQAIPEDTDPELIEKMSGLARKVINTLRSISGELRPPALAPFGLQKAIQSHIEEFQKSNSDLRVNLELMPDGNSLPEQVRLAFYRIYQTSFTNIVRHAEADQATIRLTLDEENVILEVEDDGKGFVVPSRWITLARGGHLGIVGAAERAEALGGKFEVYSAPGKGTRIRVTIPRNDEESTGLFN